MKINIHAGHNPDGKVACGAIGLIKESTEARKVKDEIIRILKGQGHTVYDCTVEDGISQSNVLSKIVRLCNENEVDLDVSIHFNAGAKDLIGNEKTTGSEVLIYSKVSKAILFSERILKEICLLGFKDRGVKVRSDLFFLKNAKAPALLVECCFVDDADDVALYNYKTMARAIVKGIIGEYEEMENVLDNIPDDYAKDAVNKAIEKGILKGDTTGNYKLHESLTRQDFFVFLDRAGLL